MFYNKTYLYKKTVFLINILFLLIFFSCKSHLDNEEKSLTMEIVEATESKEWNYNFSNRLFEIDSETLNVDILGNLGGKSLYYAFVNPFPMNIEPKYLRKIENSILVSSINSRSVIPDKFELEISANYKKKCSIRNVNVDFSLFENRSSFSSEGGIINENVKIGDVKYIYVDKNIDGTEYEQKSSTCYAVGNYCNVWIVDEFYSENMIDNKVNKSAATDIKEKFDIMYPLITNIFGTEFDEIITSSGYQSLKNSKVNIVIFDIPEENVVGYFSSKDYYWNPYSDNLIKYSNIGKYFYIDSEFFVNEKESVYSTLAHEFQHMLNFSQKDMKFRKQGCMKISSAEYNEMLSMLCEDMIQSKITNKKTLTDRIRWFNSSYYYSGIMHFRNDIYSQYSYSNLYAFGAWLCRNYGGASLLKSIMENDKVDIESIVEAVNSINKTSYTFDDLFKQFVLSLFDDSEFSFNKNAKQNITYLGYSYPMFAYNLWNYELVDSFRNKLKFVAADDYTWTGPFLLKNEIVNLPLLQNYGIQLHKVGTYDRNTNFDSVYFSSCGANLLKIYLVIM